MSVLLIVYKDQFCHDGNGNQSEDTLNFPHPCCHLWCKIYNQKEVGIDLYDNKQSQQYNKTIERPKWKSNLIDRKRFCW